MTKMPMSTGQKYPPVDIFPPTKNNATSGITQQMTIIHIIPEFPFPLWSCMVQRLRRTSAAALPLLWLNHLRGNVPIAG